MTMERHCGPERPGLTLEEHANHIVIVAEHYRHRNHQRLPSQYVRPRDPRAYTREAVTYTYLKGRGPQAMRRAGELLVVHGDWARAVADAQGDGPEVLRLLKMAGAPAPQLEIFFEEEHPDVVLLAKSRRHTGQMEAAA